jgi:putative glutamine transport system substrate-binding protein
MKKVFYVLCTYLVLVLVGCSNANTAPVNLQETKAPDTQSKQTTEATSESTQPPATEAQSTQTSATAATILKSGVLKVGTKVDVPSFGYQNADTGETEGLEVDIAKELAKRLLGDEKLIKTQGVTAQTRGPLLDNKEVDIVIATFTITDERKLSYNFTTPYYTDGIGFLVKKDLNANSIKDLDGKTVGVAQSATTKDALMKKATELGISFNYSEFASYPELKTALISGRIDAFSVDKSILLGYVDDATMVLEETFNPQQYGIVSKLDDKEWADYLNQFVEEIKADGTLDKLIQKWDL